MSPSSFARTGGGVFAGATSPNQAEASKPGTPDSAMVGTSGRALARFEPATATALMFLPLTCGSTAGMLSNMTGIWPATRSFIAGAAPL